MGEALKVVDVPGQNEVGVAVDGGEGVKEDLIDGAAAGVLGIAGKGRMMDGDDQGEAGIGSGEFAFEPVDLVLMDFALGFADVGEEADDGGEGGGEGPEDVGQVHLGAADAGFAGAELAGAGGHEILNPAIEGIFVRIDGAVLGIVGLAIMIAGDGDDEAGIILVGGVKVVAVEVDIAGKVYDVAEVIKEGGMKVLGVLGQEFGDEFLLLAAKIPGVADGMADEYAAGDNFLEVVRGKKLGQIVAIGSGPFGGRQGLKGEAGWLEPSGLGDEFLAGDGGMMAVPIRRALSGVKGVQ